MSEDARPMDANETASEEPLVEPRPALSLRQTVSLNGASCDVRFGDEVLDRFGRDLRIAVGRPGRCALVCEKGTDPELALRVRRLVTDSGFFVSQVEVPAGREAAALSQVDALCAQLMELHVTGGDAIVAVGGAEALSLCSYTASVWCGGTTLACVPTTMDALVRCPARPLALDVPGGARMVSGRPRMALCYTTPEVASAGAYGDAELLARAYEVAGAVCESKEAFNGLVMRSEAMAQGDLEALGRQALDTARGLGRVASSTSVAVRQSLAYGQVFAEGLGALCGHRVPVWALLGEGVRFAARLAVGAVEGDVDFVFAQDALLDRLGVHGVPLGNLPADALDPAVLRESMKTCALRRSNRYLFALPYAVGRVRMTAVDDAVLDEHTNAWCEAKRQGLA